MTTETAGRLGGRYLATFAACYALQGVAVAYLLNYNKAYLIAAGVDDRSAARVQSAVLLVLVLKFLLGPLSDRFSPLGLGHRRPYIAAGIALQSLGLASLGMIDPGEHLGAFAAIAVGAVVGLALADSAVDGMVVDRTPEADRARIQATLAVSRALATMACTWAFGRWLARTGIGPGRSEGLLFACAGLGLVPLAMAIACPDPDDGRAAGDRFRWSKLLGVFGRRGRALLGFGAAYGAIGLGVEFNLPLYYASLGLDQGDVGILGAARYLGRATGALALPAFGPRLGRRGPLAVGVAALAISAVGQATVSGRAGAAAWAVGFGLANGWLDALFCVLAMERSDPAMAASTFAIYMAVSNLGVVGDAVFVEALAQVGRNYRAVLAGSGAVALALLAFVPGLSRAPGGPGAPGGGR